ncbi:MAG: glycosyltransferase family 39 protein [Xanthobacteraceae bacterium]|nr:glycosyltransferase family 39 protein [Xanthobacteraceae bacterium]
MLVVLSLTPGTSGLMGPDSVGYVEIASKFAAALSYGTLHGWDWLGPTPHLMPLFVWLISLCFLTFGPEHGPIAYVLIQGMFDAGTCVIVFTMASALAPRYAMPAAVAAVLNPTQVVLGGFVYTDTVFCFFCAAAIYGSMRWLKGHSLRSAILIGAALGAAALTRVLVVPFLAVLLPFLWAAGGRRHLFDACRVGTLVVAGLVTAVLIAPVVARNVAVYGSWGLTAQSGMHTAFWIVPLVQEAKDSTPYAVTAEEMHRKAAARWKETPANPFEESRNYAELARESMLTLGVVPIAKAWVTGAVINLGAPAIVLPPPIANLPRTGFFATPGSSAFEKIQNYLFRSDNALYARLLLLGVAGVALCRIGQLLGLASLARDRTAWPALGLFVLWCAYILAVNGPIASPKYRLPIEPVLMVMLGAGITAAAGRKNPVSGDAPAGSAR